MPRWQGLAAARGDREALGERAHPGPARVGAASAGALSLGPPDEPVDSLCGHPPLRGAIRAGVEGRRAARRPTVWS
jgi:hypothetical protein